MRVTIDRERCTSVGLCNELEPEVFILDRQDSLVRFRAIGAPACKECGHKPEIDTESLSIEIPAGLEDRVIEAANECPSNAISIQK